MADVIEMIQLSPTMEEGVVVAWLKGEGDQVSAGDLIAEVETDKATMEMESFFDGVLLAILVPAGDAAPIGAPLAVVGEAGEDVASLVAELREWKPAASEGSSAEPGETTTAAEPADRASSGESGAASSGEAPAPASTPREPVAAPRATVAGSRGGRVLASPLARRLASERGYDIAAITGSGPQGRVVRRDVDAHVPTAAAASLFSRPAGQDTVEKLSQMRKAIARNVSAAWQAPAFMLSRDIAMDRLVAARQELNDALAEADAGLKLSVNDFILRACALALMDVPAMNSAFEDDAVRIYGSADIGVAVALDGGLITPVVRDAQAKSLAEIARETRELADRARQKKLMPEEFTGATFSVSNLGMYGIDHFTAVLNPPAAGILAVGALRKEPVVGPGDALTVGLRMTVTLTCDHRAVDGAVGAEFLGRFARYMEAPSVLIG